MVILGFDLLSKICFSHPWEVEMQWLSKVETAQPLLLAN